MVTNSSARRAVGGAASLCLGCRISEVGVSEAFRRSCAYAAYEVTTALTRYEGIGVDFRCEDSLSFLAQTP